MVGLTTRTNMHCDLHGPCTCVRDGMVKFVGVLRYYHLGGVRRLICTDSDDVCKLGSETPFDRSSRMVRPMDVCTTAGGDGRLVTRTCNGLCKLGAAKLHCFAMCNP